MSNRVIDGEAITISDVVAVADGDKVEILSSAIDKMKSGRARLESRLESGANLY